MRFKDQYEEDIRSIGKYLLKGIRQQEKFAQKKACHYNKTTVNSIVEIKEETSYE